MGKNDMLKPYNENKAYGFAGIGVKDVVTGSNPSPTTLQQVKNLRRLHMANGTTGNKVSADEVSIDGPTKNGVVPLRIRIGQQETRADLFVGCNDGHFDSVNELIDNIPTATTFPGGNVIENTLRNVSALQQSVMGRQQHVQITGRERLSLQVPFIDDDGSQEMLLIADVRRSIEESLPKDLHVLSGFDDLVTDQSMLANFLLRNTDGLKGTSCVELINPSSAYQGAAFEDREEVIGAHGQSPLLAVNETEFEKILRIPAGSVRSPISNGELDVHAIEQFDGALTAFFPSISIRREHTDQPQTLLSVSMGEKGGYLVHLLPNGSLHCTYTTIIGNEDELLRITGSSGKVQKNIQNTTGTGDASFSALVVAFIADMERYLVDHAPQIPNDPKIRNVAIMNATALLQRTFSQIIFHSMERNIGSLSPASLRHIFEKVAEKSVDATMASRYDHGTWRTTIPDWKVGFTSWTVGNFL